MITPQAMPYDEAKALVKKKRSVSQLQNYARCGHAYWLDRIIKVPGRKAMWFIQGTAVHEALSVYEKAFRQMTVADVQLSYERAWWRELEAELAAQPDLTMWMVGGRKKWETDRDTRYTLGLQQVADYVLANDLANPIKPIEIIDGHAGSEIGFELDFNGTRVLGYIDLVMQDERDGQIVPWDIKTGAHRPSDPYQMATYKHAIENITGQTVDWGYWWMSKDGGLSEPQDLRPYTFDRVAAWYNKLDAGVENGVFLANPGDACFTCTARPWCDIIQPYALPLPDGAIKLPLVVADPHFKHPNQGEIDEASRLLGEEYKANPNSKLKIEDFMNWGETLPNGGSLPDPTVPEEFFPF